ncbi:MAG: glycosyltransferase family 2 protein [Rhodospirillaceae bacterium]|nr:glycosyltransferase family 2 protein [Rhodospirillaceae bacterium]
MKGRVTVISPCYNEGENARICYQAVKEVFEQALPDYECEHIFADNASTDDTPQILADLAAADPHVRVIVNARNVGPLRSVYNALKSASGDATLVMMAVDLQDPPELIAEFVRLWEQGHMVVQGVRSNREEGFIFRTTRKLFYRAVKLMSNIDIPVDVGEFQLIDRKVQQAVVSFNDHYPYIRGMIAYCGFKPYSVPYTLRARKRGFSKNRFFTLVDIALNGLLTFTTAPIRVLTGIGITLSISSLLYALVNFLLLAFNRDSAVPPGVATLIVAFFFFSGVQFLFLGILGEYIVSTHGQVRFGSLVVEAKRINFDDQKTATKDVHGNA